MSLVRHQDSKNWYAAFMIDGKKYFKSTGTANKQLAARIEHHYKNEVIERNKLGGGKQPITLNKAFDLYLKSRNNTIALQKTRNTVERVLGIVPDPMKNGKTRKLFKLDGNKEIHKLTDGELAQFVMNRRVEGYSESTIFAHISVIRGAIAIASELGYETNPHLKFPKTKVIQKEVKYLTKEQQIALLRELDPEQAINPVTGKQRQAVHDVVLTILDLGLRISEVLPLVWDDIDFERNVIHIRSVKSKKESHMHLSDRLIEMFTKRFQNKRCRWVFPNKEGTGPRSISAAGLKAAAKRAGIKGFESFHQLRRTYASRLLQSGLPIFEVSKLLHHSDVKTTLRYAALAPTQASVNARDMLNKINE